MRIIKYFCLIIFFFLTANTFAQISPLPEIEKEIRSGTSIRMRSTELERIKRDANKLNSDETNEESKIRFVAIKEDFEAVQKLQNSIIKAYTKGKKIDYKKIAESAEDMNKKARRLDENLFGATLKGLLNEREPEDLKQSKQKNVRKLIIELDKAIGKFVASPVFKDLKTIDSEASKDAQNELEIIINLSQNLFRSAEDLK